MRAFRHYPRYVQVYSSIRERILSNELKPGDQLPSQHELAAQHNVAFATLQHALKLLEEEQLIVRKQGLGTFIADPDQSVPHVLVVDGDSLVRETLGTIIQESGFIAESAANGESALAALERRHFAQAFIDIRLSDTSGAKLAADASEISPDTAIVILSGEPEDLVTLAEHDF